MLTTDELLAVGFTLSGAAGAVALLAEGANQRIKRWIGGVTLLCAIVIAGFYLLIKTGSHHLSDELVKYAELMSYSVAAFLSFCSEIVAES